MCGFWRVGSCGEPLAYPPALSPLSKPSPYWLSLEHPHFLPTLQKCPYSEPFSPTHQLFRSMLSRCSGINQIYLYDIFFLEELEDKI